MGGELGPLVAGNLQYPEVRKPARERTILEDKGLGLQVLIAGCPRDERSRVEGTVRRAVGDRAEQGPWTISLVRLGGEWQVTVDGPDPSLRQVSLTVPEIRLQNAIVEVIAKSPAPPGGVAAPGGVPRPSPPPSSPAAPVPAPAATPVPSAGESRDKHECPKCGQGFVVIYAKQAGEGTTKAPVACPKCWQVMKVPIASEAAQHQDYRAESV